MFERSLLDELGHFDGINTKVDKYLDAILDKRNNRFCLRSEAEEDESLKQIIPYIVFCYEDKVFSYVRGKQAGETRLVGNRSIGIGGHINPADEMMFDVNRIASDRNTYLEAVNREIAEEVMVDGPFEPSIKALINDDSNPVGRVHFGIVHLCTLSHENVRKREQQITQAGFIQASELAGPMRPELESWSAFCIDMLV